MQVLIIGANRGIGVELVAEFLAQGDRVVALNRGSSPRFEALLTSGSPLHVVGADVSSEQSLEAAAQELEGTAVDLIVFNAAIHLEQEREDILLTKPEDVLTTFDVNTVGAVRATKHLRPLLKDGGQLVYISSEAGSIGQCWRGSEYGYCMSKAALNMFARLMQKRENDCNSGVRVSAIHPGWVRTDMGGPDADDAPELAARELVLLMKKEREVADTSTGSGIYTDRSGTVMPW